MAIRIEIRPRIRLPDASEQPAPRARRSPVLIAGLGAWLASVAVAWGVQAGTIPVAQWLEPDNERTADRAARRPTPPRAPRPLPPPPARPLPPPLPPPEPLPLPDPVAAVDPGPPLSRPDLTEPPVPNPNLALPPSPGLAARPAKTTLGLTRDRDPVDAPAPRERPLALRADPVPVPAPAPPPAREPRAPKPALDPNGPGSSAGTSCEAAVAAYREEMEIGGKRGPADLSAADYGAVLNRGTWFASCGVPEDASIDVCVAVRNGRAVGVTVRTAPRYPAAERCVARAARGLSFPSHPRLDVARTRFD